MSIDLRAAFDEADREFLKFEQIKSPRHPCPDVCALLLLTELVPREPGKDIVSSVSHDEIWLNVDCDELAKVATQEHVVELRRCGVMYDMEMDCLSMFV